jgi:alpha-tubulin suppressor-like RCC1 family protein
MGAATTQILPSGTVAVKMAYTAPNMTTGSIAIHSNMNNVLVTDGNLYTLGDSSYAQTAFGTTEKMMTTPYRVKFPNNPYIVYGSINYPGGYAIDSTGQIYGWGINTFGKIDRATNTR